MLSGCENLQGLVECPGLPFGEGVPPIAFVGIEGVYDFVGTPVLGCLVVVKIGCRGVKQGKPEGMVVGFIRTEFAIFKDRGSEVARQVGQVEPFA